MLIASLLLLSLLVGWLLWPPPRQAPQGCWHPFCMPSDAGMYECVECGAKVRAIDIGPRD